MQYLSYCSTLLGFQIGALMKRIFFILQVFSLFLYAADYDCVFIGTSPVPFFEAIYQRALGKKVLILEEAPECGGAWKSITACGIEHADLGCHQIGGDQALANFLATYGGCRIVSLDQPLEAYNNRGGNGFYFSRGCFELVDHLVTLARLWSADLWTNHRLDSVSFDETNHHLVLRTQGKVLTTNRLYVTHGSCFGVNNQPASPGRGKYYHLYLLIHDATPPRFSYRGGIRKASRMVNLTHFVGLSNTGQQLIVLQTHGDETGRAQEFVDDLKREKLIDQSAILLRSEPRIYEQGSCQGLHLLSPEARGMIETLDTGHIANLRNHITRWSQALKPYQEMFGK
jgi:hypothetical protein